jgi:hypothetical protein
MAKLKPKTKKQKINNNKYLLALNSGYFRRMQKSKKRLLKQLKEKRKKIKDKKSGESIFEKKDGRPKYNHIFNPTKYFKGKLQNIFECKKYSDSYCNKINKLFDQFFIYLFNTDKKHSIANNCKEKASFEISKTKRIKLKDAYNFIMSNKKYKSDSTKYYLLLTMRKFIKIINNEENINFNVKNVKPKKNPIKVISQKEVYAIINHIKENNDLQIMLIFYFLYVKGLNYTSISRILLKDFKNEFSILITKKGKKSKYKIHQQISEKLYAFFKTQNYNSLFFFYNDIKNGINSSRTQFIKNAFKNVLDKTFWIKNERKELILDLFSKMRQPKKYFDINILINEKGFSYGFFDKNLSPLKASKNNILNPGNNKTISNQSKDIDNSDSSKHSFLLSNSFDIDSNYVDNIDNDNLDSSSELFLNKKINDNYPFIKKKKI